VRGSGTDAGLEELARKNTLALAAGHSFIIFLGDGFYPINVLNAIKMVPEVCRIFCATANPTEVVLAETEQGRGILGSGMQQFHCFLDDRARTLPGRFEVRHARTQEAASPGGIRQMRIAIEYGF